MRYLSADKYLIPQQNRRANVCNRLHNQGFYVDLRSRAVVLLISTAFRSVVGPSSIVSSGPFCRGAVKKWALY
jgi:hypothetical protein